MKQAPTQLSNILFYHFKILFIYFLLCDTIPFESCYLMWGLFTCRFLLNIPTIVHSIHYVCKIEIIYYTHTCSYSFYDLSDVILTFHRFSNSMFDTFSRMFCVQNLSYIRVDHLIPWEVSFLFSYYYFYIHFWNCL